MVQFKFKKSEEVLFCNDIVTLPIILHLLLLSLLPSCPPTLCDGGQRGPWFNFEHVCLCHSCGLQLVVWVQLHSHKNDHGLMWLQQEVHRRNPPFFNPPPPPIYFIFYLIYLYLFSYSLQLVIFWFSSGRWTSVTEDDPAPSLFTAGNILIFHQ